MEVAGEFQNHHPCLRYQEILDPPHNCHCHHCISNHEEMDVILNLWVMILMMNIVVEMILEL